MLLSISMCTWHRMLASKQAWFETVGNQIVGSVRDHKHTPHNFFTLHSLFIYNYPLKGGSMKPHEPALDLPLKCMKLSWCAPPPKGTHSPCMDGNVITWLIINQVQQGSLKQACCADEATVGKTLWQLRVHGGKNCCRVQIMRHHLKETKHG